MKKQLLTTIVSGLLTLFSAGVMATHSNSHVRKIANAEITKRAPELRGNVGPQGPRGVEGPRGVAAIQRYAHVRANGTVDAGQSNGITQGNVFRDSQGIYCFTGLSLVNGGSVTGDVFDPAGFFLAKTATFGTPDFAGCESVVFIVNSDGLLVDSGFFVTLY